MGRIRLFSLLFQNGCSQSSRFLPQARRIVGSGDKNASAAVIRGRRLFRNYEGSSRGQKKSREFHDNESEIISGESELLCRCGTI